MLACRFTFFFFNHSTTISYLVVPISHKCPIAGASAQVSTGPAHPPSPRGYGALPVCVLEGQSPPEKLELLRARFKAMHGFEGGGGGNIGFNRTQRHIAGMLRAMVRHSMQLP